MSTTHVKPVVVTDSTGAILAKIEEKKRIAKADCGKYLRIKMPVMKQDSASRCTTCVALFDIMETNRTREMFLLDVLQHAAIDSGELSTKVKTRETNLRRSQRACSMPDHRARRGKGEREKLDKQNGRAVEGSRSQRTRAQQ